MILDIKILIFYTKCKNAWRLVSKSKYHNHNELHIIQKFILY